MNDLQTNLLIAILTLLSFVTLLVLVVLIYRKRYIFFRSLKSSKFASSSVKANAIKITDAVQELSATKTGGLIILERKNSLANYYSVILNANIESLLIVTLFNKTSPLHDGAIIIKNGIIKTCSCYLPNSSSKVDVRLGSRHRAALGITELTDALSIVVSESDGRISCFQDKKMNTLNDSTELVSIILKFLSNKK